MIRLLGLIAASIGLFGHAAFAQDANAAAAASNMQIIGRSDLNGAGKGGEGLAIRQYADGRRVLYLAHESGPMCVSVLDVSHPEQPTVITQVKVEADHVRCNSLGLAGNTLVVAHQTEKAGQSGAGLDTYDIADPKHAEEARALRYVRSAFARGPLRLVHRWALRLSVHRRARLHAAQQERRPVPDDRRCIRSATSARDRAMVAARHARGRQRTAAAAGRTVRRRRAHALAGRAAGKAGPRLCRLDRWRLDDPRYRRQGASETRRAPLVAIGRRWLRPHRASYRQPRACDPDRGGDDEQLQGLAEAQLGVGHQRRAVALFRSPCCRRRPTRRRCARPAAGSARTTST